MVDETDSEAPKKSSALVMTIVAVAVLTVIGGGAGWALGGFLTPPIAEAEKARKQAEEAAAAAATKKEDDEGLPRLATPENGIVQLEAITTNLSYPAESWVRLEVALLFNDKPDVKISEAVHQDIMTYLRTVTLQQIEGPRGFQYLKEDLEERADLLSEGKVSTLLFRSFVIE